MKYCATVEQHFRSPRHAGLPRGQGGVQRRGEAGSMARGAWIVFHARIESGRIAELTFQAYGCPHVIAACSRTTERLTGEPPAVALAYDAAGLMPELDMPVAKRGSLLVLEDALQNCFRDWDTTQPAGIGCAAKIS
jgi:NifU-like protein involved in Fe-S cluster formation